MQIYYPEIIKSDLRLEAANILKLLGDQQDVVDAYSEKLVHQYIGECVRISTPRGAFIITEALETDSSLDISTHGATFHTGNIIRKMLHHSESYALLLVSAGPGPEGLARELLDEGNYLEGYIADLVASYMTDQLAERVQEEIRELAEKSALKITNRYSPGYCSWDVAEQQKLFSLFPETCCGVSLSDSSLMNPVKSLSAIIGIGTKVEYRDYTCEICSMKNCKFRKERMAGKAIFRN